MSNESLKIEKVEAMVNMLIERAPRWTMVRELTKNAIEAAEHSKTEKIVHWTVGKHDGVQKAVIWNTGVGLDDREIKIATNLACQIDKKLGVDENFGVGAKISCLASNKNGMRFRSCKNGRVSEVILGFDEEAECYVRFERTLPDGRTSTVIDVTDIASREGRDVRYDWTEVTLLGNSPEQDTAAKLFSDEDTEKAYVANNLYRRFYRLPDGVKVRLDSIFHRLDGTRSFVPMGQRSDKFSRTETVERPDFGIKIHYLHDSSVGDKSGLRMSSRGAISSSTTTCCLVHKNEMYSVLTGPAWSSVAPKLGIPFGSTELCVHIEISDQSARPSQYRERLISKTNGEDIVPEDYALFVREAMPDWVKEVIKNASPRQTVDFSDLRKELQNLLDDYKVKIVGRKIDPVNGKPSTPSETGEVVSTGAKGGGGSGGQGGGFGSGEGGNGKKPGSRRFHEAPDGATTTSTYEIYEKAPEIIMLIKPEDVEEKNLQGRAASFVEETGYLFVNGLYEAVDRACAVVEPEFTGQADDETVRKAVVEGARKAMAFRVGKATVFALAKRANEHWTQDAMQQALTRESLSIAADDYREGLAGIKRYVRDYLKTEIIKAA